MQPKPMGETAAGPCPTGRFAEAGEAMFSIGGEPYRIAPEKGAGRPRRRLGYHPRLTFPRQHEQRAHAMIIDCHGHYTTAPQAFTDFREAQKAALKDPVQTPSRESLKVSDD